MNLDDFVCLYAPAVTGDEQCKLYEPTVSKLEYVQLLIAAAKAAGLQDATVRQVVGVSWYECHIQYRKAPGVGWAYMNPLRSNGDALWLAARLCLDLYTEDGDGRVGCLLPNGETEVWVSVVDDSLLSLRLAIVRAAAECLNCANFTVDECVRPM